MWRYRTPKLVYLCSLFFYISNCILQSATSNLVRCSCSFSFALPSFFSLFFSVSLLFSHFLFCLSVCPSLFPSLALLTCLFSCLSPSRARNLPASSISRNFSRPTRSPEAAQNLGAPANAPLSWRLPLLGSLLPRQPPAGRYWGIGGRGSGVEPRAIDDRAEGCSDATAAAAAAPAFPLPLRPDNA